MRTTFEVKVLPRIGDPEHGGEVQEGTHLHRVIKWNKDGFTWQADPKYAKQLVKDMGLEGTKGVETPASKETGKNERNVNEPLSESGTREYLAKYPTEIWKFDEQEMPKRFYTYSDSDWATCKSSRKSMSCYALRYGQHLLETSCAKQSCVALSSGEAEYYALTRAASAGLLLKNVLEEIQRETEMICLTDSSAAKGITARHGVGRVKHLSLKELWVQDMVAKKTFKFQKESTETNWADIGTKVLDAARISRLVEMMPLKRGIIAASLLTLGKCQGPEEYDTDEDACSTLVDFTHAREAVASALQVLREFYAKAQMAAGAKSLVQTAQSSVAHAPDIFSDEPYTGLGGESGGVVSMMEVIESDFAHLQAETEAQEEAAKSEYQETLVSRGDPSWCRGVDKAVKIKTGEHKTNKKTGKSEENIRVLEVEELVTLEGDLAGTNKELEAANAYFECPGLPPRDDRGPSPLLWGPGAERRKLKPDCFDTGVSYAERKAQREEERCGCVATLQTGTPRQGDETAGAEDAGGLSAGSDELDIPKHVLVLAPSRATKNETDVGQSVTDRGSLGDLAHAPARVSSFPPLDLAPQKRKNVTNGAESYPLGLYVMDWAAAHATSAVAQILLEEKLGYSVVPDMGISTPDAFFALAGCLQPTNTTDRGCGSGPTGTYYHISLEGWTLGYIEMWKELQQTFPATAPRLVGQMGYMGEVSTFIPKSAQAKAYEAEGRSMDFYRDFNVSWNKPWRYFGSPRDVDKTRLMRCELTTLNRASPQMRVYGELLGDWDGLVMEGSGEYRAKCMDDYFWYSPACRGNSSECVLVLSGGTGWSLEEFMQKAAAFSMPWALCVAANWSEYASLPFDYTSAFYWWTPDPTFLRIDPTKMFFPPHDGRAWNLGDRSSANQAVAIDKFVSKDLEILAPDAEDLVKAFMLDEKSVNEMLLDSIDTADSWRSIACRWLQGNPALWESWIPDKSTCFAQFGLFHELDNKFVKSREDPTHLTCRACPSGFFSQELTDGVGVTFICEECPVGSSQASGASLSCLPCAAGEYQDTIGSLSCKRCPFAAYQDIYGSSGCKDCPAGTTTLGVGSSSLADCGCESGSINIASEAMVFNCSTCGEGLDCPTSSSIANLQSASSAAGENFVPQIAAGYFATKEEPMMIYKCTPAVKCPGGKPGVCAGGLEGIPCGVCPVAMTWSETRCKTCDGGTMTAWGCAGLIGALGLAVAYHVVNTSMTAQASPFQAATMCANILVNVFQTIAILGMMTVAWPQIFQATTERFQVFLLDFERFSLSCLAGPSNVQRWTFSAVMFPCAALWLLFLQASSQCLPDRFKQLRRKLPKTLNTIGVFLEAGFGTMSAVGMQPLMCYLHPNGLYSVLNFPSVICRSGEHITMAVLGVVLLSFALAFLASCLVASWKMPSWSLGNGHALVQSFRFLTSKFRMNAWWFGVLLPLRSFLLSLAVVVATNLPPAQSAAAAIVLALYSPFQILLWPWKVPYINAADLWLNAMLLLLVNSSVVVEGTTADDWKEFGTIYSGMILSFIALGACFMILRTAAALVQRHLLKNSGQEWIDPECRAISGKAAKALKRCAQDLMEMEVATLEGEVMRMNASDLKIITSAITLISMEICPSSEQQLFHTRVALQSFNQRLTRVTNVDPGIVLKMAEDEDEDELSDRNVGATSPARDQSDEGEGDQGDLQRLSF
ncbi:Retrovirus-related Pol polyprotein from transposon TNT 1-94 [Includes: Protease [Durusdinium trenchii]|uniref:Retrovirus-related Pol polyprotein from transposon TNT 1-94 n=1 Tax=Durusdinium trenchii TaxID=1381693 RepID=A0ABP0K4I7_9DINO